MDGFATEATHRLTYFSSLSRSEYCNRLRLLYTFQTIQTMSYTCTLTDSNFIHAGTMTVKVIQYLNYSVSHRYNTHTTMIFNHECKLSPLPILLTSFYPTHMIIFGA